MKIKPPKIGLTGGIGAGKTIVSKIFIALNIPVYPADGRAKDLLNRKPGLISAIKERFGEKAYTPEGKINRDYMAKYVFNDDKKLQALNRLVHPEVTKDYARWLKIQRSPYTIKEAAILFETGTHRNLDKIINVSAPKEIRKSRVLTRDPHRNTPQVEAIMEKQLSESERNANADFVVVNDGTQSVIEQVLQIHHQILAEKELN